MKKRVYYEYSTKDVEQIVLQYAKSQSVPDNWAKQIAKRVSKATDDWIADKDIVTEDDLRGIIYREIKVLDKALAFA